MTEFYKKVIYIKNLLNGYFINDIVNIIICDYYICKYDCGEEDNYNYLMQVTKETNISGIIYNSSDRIPTFEAVNINSVNNFWDNIDIIYYYNYTQSEIEGLSHDDCDWCIFARCTNNIHFVLTLNCLDSDIFYNTIDGDTISRIDLRPAKNIYDCIKHCFDRELNDWYCKNN